MVFLGSRVFPWRERWKSCDLHHFPPWRPALCPPVPRAALVQKQLLPSGRGTRWKVPGMTQISGRSPLTPCRSKGLCVGKAECWLGFPSPIPPAPALSMALASSGASHSSPGSFCAFSSSLGDAPAGPPG